MPDGGPRLGEAHLVPGGISCGHNTFRYVPQLTCWIDNSGCSGMASLARVVVPAPTTPRHSTLMEWPFQAYRVLRQSNGKECLHSLLETLCPGTMGHSTLPALSALCSLSPCQSFSFSKPGEARAQAIRKLEGIAERMHRDLTGLKATVGVHRQALEDLGGEFDEESNEGGVREDWGEKEVSGGGDGEEGKEGGESSPKQRRE